MGEMEAHRVGSKTLNRGGRQNVLTGMLLHQVKAALPIHLTPDLCGGQGPAQHVNDSCILLALYDIDDSGLRPRFCISEQSGIVRLASASGVEGGAVKDHCQLSLPLELLNDPG